MLQGSNRRQNCPKGPPRLPRPGPVLLDAGQGGRARIKGWSGKKKKINKICRPGSPTKNRFPPRTRMKKQVKKSMTVVSWVLLIHPPGPSSLSTFTAPGMGEAAVGSGGRKRSSNQPPGRPLRTAARELPAHPPTEQSAAPGQTGRRWARRAKSAGGKASVVEDH